MGGGGGVGTGSESLSSSELMALATELSEEVLDELELDIGLRGSLSPRDDGRSLSDPPPDEVLFLLKEFLSCFPDSFLSLFELL